MAVESTPLVSGRTLFVRNLPYGTSDKELESAFCECGLLKSCFTVKEKGAHQKECKLVQQMNNFTDHFRPC